MENFDKSLPAKFKVLPDGVLITNAAGEILWFNSAFEMMCGYTLPEVEGKKPGSFLQGEKTDPEVVANMRAAISAGMPCSAELVNYHKDGHEYLVHITLTPVRKKTGEIKYFAAIEREFTEQELAKFGRANLENVLQNDLADLIRELEKD